LFGYLFSFRLCCGFWRGRWGEALGDGGGDGADLDAAEVEDELGGAGLFGDAHFLDDGDEAGLGEDLVADAQAGQLVALLPLVLVHGAEEGEVEEDSDGSRVGEREDEDSFHSVIQVRGARRQEQGEAVGREMSEVRGARYEVRGMRYEAGA
jgi:hypothetical protein